MQRGRSHGLCLATALGIVALTGCSLLGLDGLSNGEGGGTGDAPSAASSTASTAGGGETPSSSAAGSGGSGGSGSTGGGAGHGGEGPTCQGCTDEAGACQPGDTIAACGSDAGTCTVCQASSACEVVSCVDGACVTETLPADTACDAGGGIGSGACLADGACEAVPENCANGVDDDGNGDVDCEDASCGAFMCFPEAPPLWLGPFHVYEGNALSCPVAAGREGLPPFGAAIDAPPLQCPDCSCRTTCEAEMPYAFGASAVCDNANFSATLPEDVCTVVGAQGVDLRYAFGQATATGTCTTMTNGEAVVPPVGFAARLTSCEPNLAGGGCASSFTCVPRPPPVGGLTAQLCIAREGDRTCPPEFPDRSTAGEAIDDERSCTACGCAVETCEGTIQVSPTPDCACGACKTVKPGAGDCGELTSKDVSALYKAQGSCSANGSQQTGSIGYVEPYTICCAP